MRSAHLFDNKIKVASKTEKWIESLFGASPVPGSRTNQFLALHEYQASVVEGSGRWPATRAAGVRFPAFTFYFAKI